MSSCRWACAHLDLLVNEYVAHYHAERPHQSLDNKPLDGSSATAEGVPKPAAVTCKSASAASCGTTTGSPPDDQAIINTILGHSSGSRCAPSRGPGCHSPKCRIRLPLLWHWPDASGRRKPLQGKGFRVRRSFCTGRGVRSGEQLRLRRLGDLDVVVLHHLVRRRARPRGLDVLADDRRHAGRATHPALLRPRDFPAGARRRPPVRSHPSAPPPAARPTRPQPYPSSSGSSRG